MARHRHCLAHESHVLKAPACVQTGSEVQADGEGHLLRDLPPLHEAEALPEIGDRTDSGA